jgi:hypothetical protein
MDVIAWVGDERSEFVAPLDVKLTDAQLVMLSAASQREDHCLTAPDKMKGAILAKAGEKLMKLGLVREIRAKAGTPVWLRDDAGSFALKLTAAGLKAVAVDDGSDQAAEGRDAPLPRPDPSANKVSVPDPTGPRARATPREGSKLAQIIDLLKRSDGATILHLMGATGWLPHPGSTDRAAQARVCGGSRTDRRGDSVNRIAGIVGDGGERFTCTAASQGRVRGPEPKANQAA